MCVSFTEEPDFQTKYFHLVGTIQVYVCQSLNDLSYLCLNCNLCLNWPVVCISVRGILSVVGA